MGGKAPGIPRGMHFSSGFRIRQDLQPGPAYRTGCTQEVERLVFNQIKIGFCRNF